MEGEVKQAVYLFPEWITRRIEQILEVLFNYRTW